MNIEFRTADPTDLFEIQQLFVDTISTVCRRDYNDEQIKAWTSSIENTNRWLNIINDQFFLLAQLKNQIVGYGSLDNATYVDLLFVHKDFQRQGIAQRILSRLEEEAKRLNAEEITSNVSKTARPFFEKNHFKVTAEQKNLRKGIEIVNYKMVKVLL